MTQILSRITTLVAVCALVLSVGISIARAEDNEMTTTGTNTATNTEKHIKNLGPARPLPPPPIRNLVKPKEGTSTDKMKDRAEEMRDRQENKNKEDKSGEQGRAHAIQQIKQNIVRYVRLIEATINREEKLITRIQSRSDKLAGEGKDISTVTTAITTAKGELTAAKLDIAGIKTVASTTITITGSTTPATVFGPVRDLIQSAQKHLRAAHQAIMDAVKALKKLHTPVTATTTESESD